MSDFVSEKPTSVEEVEAQQTKIEPHHDVVEKVEYNRTGAIDAENIEHRMGVLEAVRAYPAASWWALVMSCTIVRFSAHRFLGHTADDYRSWSHTVSS